MAGVFLFTFTIHHSINNEYLYYTAQKMKFSIKGFFSKCDQIHSSLRIWSHLLKKSLMENFIFVRCYFMGNLEKCYFINISKIFIENLKNIS